MTMEIEQTIELIETLKGDLVKEATTGFFMDDMFYKKTRADLLRDTRVKSLLPEFLRGVRNRVEFYQFISTKFENSNEKIKFLKDAFEPALASLEKELFDGEPGEATKFLSAGSDHDAFVEIRKMVKAAKNELIVVDPYVDETLWQLLGNVDKSVHIKVLTNHMKSDFLVEGKKFAKQHGNKLEVRTTSSYHDRFVVVDAKQCWHLGASIKDAGAKACLISEIISSGVVSAVISDIVNAWTSANPVGP
jgi:sugar-specific transcriptional regulator TrmB